MANIRRRSSGSRSNGDTLLPFRRELDRLFDDFFSSSLQEADSGNAVWAPRLDLSETDNEYRLTMDLPGLSKEDVKVDYQEGELIISGERKEEKEEEKPNYIRRERIAGSFYRSMKLPQDVNPENITANFKGGVLKVKIPKSEKSKPKQIEVA